MSYHENLLVQTELLKPIEIRSLEEWLDTLKEDIARFGPTAKDKEHIARIITRLAREPLSN